MREEVSAPHEYDVILGLLTPGLFLFFGKHGVSAFVLVFPVDIDDTLALWFLFFYAFVPVVWSIILDWYITEYIMHYHLMSCHGSHISSVLYCSMLGSFV